MADTNRIKYMDYNATCPLLPAAKEAMLDVMDAPNNASAVHKTGRNAHLHVEKSRQIIANTLNAKAEGVIFTSGATEANNTILRGFQNRDIFVSALEHPAVLNATPDATILPVNQNGLVDLEALDTALANSKRPALVSIMLVNNETGVIQPLKNISDIVHRHGGLLHSDCVQALGRIDIDMQDMGIDILSLSGHKIGGPQGIGALVIDPKIEFTPLLRGGGQEKNRRAGTENVTGIVGFGAAIENLDKERVKTLEQMRDRLESELLEISPEVIIHAKDAPRVSNTSMFSLPGISSDTQMIHMDLAGIAVSNGSACSSGRVEPSHVLKAMGCGDDIASSALRISLGWASQESDIDAFLEAWKKLYDRVGSRLNP